jgi:hypothetical protein
METCCTRKLSWRARNITCCGNTVERQRKILSNLDSPGDGAQQFYSDFQSLNASLFLLWTSKVPPRTCSLRLRRLGTSSSASLP